MSECPEQWKLDVNDRYARGVSVVTSLSTAPLVLPMLYLKNIAAADTTKPRTDSLSCLVYFVLVCLGVSIISSVIYYYFSAKWVKNAWGETPDIFDRPITGSSIEKWLDRSLFFMMSGFLIGLGCIVYFVASCTNA